MATRQRNDRSQRDSASSDSGGVAAVDINMLDSVVQKAVAAAVSVLHSEFKNLIDDLSRRISSVEVELNAVREEANEVRKSTNEDSTKIAVDLTKRLEDTEKKLTTFREEAREFSRQANDTEQYSRRKNIRIKGLRMGNDDNCRESVLEFCRTVLHSTISDDDIEIAHHLPRRNLPSGTNQSSRTQDSVVIVRFFSQEARDDIIKRRKVLKGSRQSIMEDLTALNVDTLNRLKNHRSVNRCWSWNGRLFATLIDGKKIMVKPYQPVEDATVLS